MFLVAMAILIVIAIIYGTNEFLAIAVLIGIISGVTSYYIFRSRGEIKKIIRDDKEEIEIASGKVFWIIVMSGSLVCVSYNINSFSFISFVTGLGLLAIVVVIAFEVLIIFAKLYPPTKSTNPK